MKDNNRPEHSALGKETQYEAIYNPALLFPIARKTKRDEIGITGILPFVGVDIWNHYEVSWLNQRGKPMVAIAEIRYDCASSYIIESKSLKLYFNSLNNTVFESVTAVEALVQRDLIDRLCTTAVMVSITLISHYSATMLQRCLPGYSIDELDVECTAYTVNPASLITEEHFTEETLCTDLLKSNCLITHQPDWCSVQIHYRGRQINHAGLLRYIVSFRNHNEFHEQCIEKIFMHIVERCRPEVLTVYGRSTRRGGVDINAYRSTEPLTTVPNQRLCWQ